MKSQMINPNVRNFVKSLRDIGYTFEIAVADLIDNCITAQASTIKIYTVPQPNLIFGLLDDGKGMSKIELIEAMRLASKDPDEQRSHNDLGRFGLGLKTSSFSQCRKLTVLSKQNGKISIAQWDLDYITSKNSWMLKFPNINEVYHMPLIDEFIQSKKGTLVIWEEIDRYEKDTFSGTIDKLRKHISLVFHRFIEGSIRSKKLKIYINNDEITAFDPFNTNNPYTQELAVEKIKQFGHIINIQPFILPHHSKVSQQEYERYATEDGYTKSQGFYLYRENRLLIYGTWWGLHRIKDAHRLVRIKIDISNKQDLYWAIDIKKSTANPCQEIKGDLKRIINQITEKGSRPYTGRGKKIKDTTTTRFWNLAPFEGGLRFTINGDHPLLKKLKLELSSDQNELLKMYLSAIQSYLPLDAIHAQLQENPHEIKQEYVYSDDELKKIMEYFKKSGVEPSYLEELKKAELFKNRLELFKLWN